MESPRDSESRYDKSLTACDPLPLIFDSSLCGLRIF